MNSKDISRDLINVINTLYMSHRKDGEGLYDSRNPVSELITPEWHYSDSIRILNSTQISWDNLAESNLIKTVAESLEKAEIPNAVAGIEFERSYCAWYQPYHYLPLDKWGIHMRYDSLIRIAWLLFHNCPSRANRIFDAAKSAFLYLFIHELFHHIVENATSIMEILSGKSNLYTKYYTDVYSQVFNSSDCIEEALSNGYLFQWAEECHIDKEFLKPELLKQGPGYCDFVQFIGSRFYEGNRVLLSQIREGSLNPIKSDPLEEIINVPDPIQYSSLHNVPIWLHRKARPVH